MGALIEAGTDAAEEPPLPDLSPDARVRAHQLYERALRAQREGRWADYGDAINALGETLTELRGEADAAADADADADAPAVE